MIITENIVIDERDLVKTYSDTYYIVQNETGVMYREAIDIPGHYTYIESGVPLPTVGGTQENPAEYHQGDEIRVEEEHKYFICDGVTRAAYCSGVPESFNDDNFFEIY